MKEKLLELLNNSYSPYSHFRVAAIAVMKDGTEFKGVNVENASYGATICAERNAINSAISNGYKKYDFLKLYTMCDSPKTSSSCFLCRQVIAELFERDCEVVFMSNKGESLSYKVSDICPYPFDESDLNEK